MVGINGQVLLPSALIVHLTGAMEEITRGLFRSLRTNLPMESSKEANWVIGSGQS